MRRTARSLVFFGLKMWKWSERIKFKRCAKVRAIKKLQSRMDRTRSSSPTISCKRTRSLLLGRSFITSIRKFVSCKWTPQNFNNNKKLPTYCQRQFASKNSIILHNFLSANAFLNLLNVFIIEHFSFAFLRARME